MLQTFSFFVLLRSGWSRTTSTRRRFCGFWTLKWTPNANLLGFSAMLAASGLLLSLAPTHPQHLAWGYVLEESIKRVSQHVKV